MTSNHQKQWGVSVVIQDIQLGPRPNKLRASAKSPLYIARIKGTLLGPSYCAMPRNADIAIKAAPSQRAVVLELMIFAPWIISWVQCSTRDPLSD